MDVLQFMKERHESLRFLKQSLAWNSPVGVKDFGRSLQLQLHIEKEYLCPEMEDRFAGADVVMDVIESNHSAILRLAGEIWPGTKGPTKGKGGVDLRFEALKDQVDRHLDAIEKLLMPKIRQAVPTAEREELGQVLRDVVEDQKTEEPNFSVQHAALKVVAPAKPAKVAQPAATKKSAGKPVAKKRRA